MSGHLHLESFYPMAPCRSWAIAVDLRGRKSPPLQNGTFPLGKLVMAIDESRINGALLSIYRFLFNYELLLIASVIYVHGLFIAI